MIAQFRAPVYWRLIPMCQARAARRVQTRFINCRPMRRHLARHRALLKPSALWLPSLSFIPMDQSSVCAPRSVSALVLIQIVLSAAMVLMIFCIFCRWPMWVRVMKAFSRRTVFSFTKSLFFRRAGRPLLRLRKISQQMSMRFWLA